MSKAQIFREFRFEAAHRLPNVPPEHKCSRLHGHSYHVTVQVAGDIDSRTGWIMDFGDIKVAMGRVLDALDHSCLNEVAGLENPTSEHLARWIWTEVSPAIKGLSAVTVRETETSGCIYRGD